MQCRATVHSTTGIGTSVKQDKKGGKMESDHKATTKNRGKNTNNPRTKRQTRLDGWLRIGIDQNKQHNKKGNLVTYQQHKSIRDNPIKGGSTRKSINGNYSHKQDTDAKYQKEGWQRPSKGSTQQHGKNIYKKKDNVEIIHGLLVKLANMRVLIISYNGCTVAELTSEVCTTNNIITKSMHLQNKVNATDEID